MNWKAQTRNKLLRFWRKKSHIKHQKFPPLKFIIFQLDFKKNICMIGKLAVLETRVLNKWESQNKLKRKTLLRLSKYQKSPKMTPFSRVAKICFESITYFTTMCLNVETLFFQKRILRGFEMFIPKTFYFFKFNFLSK